MRKWHLREYSILSKFKKRPFLELHITFHLIPTTIYDKHCTKFSYFIDMSTKHF